MLYELYEKVLNAYKNGTKEEFSIAATAWVEHANENPYTNREAHLLFFNAKKYYRAWRNQGIDMRSAKRNMVACVRKIIEMELSNPYKKEKKEEKKIEEPKKKATNKIKDVKKEEPKQTEEDVRFAMLAMVNAYNLKDEERFRQAATHMIEIAKENPFKVGTEEFKCFDEMVESFQQHNIRRLVVVAQQLCDIINYTEIEPTKIKKVKTEEQETVLGVVPEKKSWFKFLRPREKEGE